MTSKKENKRRFLGLTDIMDMGTETEYRTPCIATMFFIFGAMFASIVFVMARRRNG